MILKKMESACSNRPDIALEVFSKEILDVPQSLSTNGVSLYHGKQSDISNRLTSQEQIPGRECQSPSRYL